MFVVSCSILIECAFITEAAWRSLYVLVSLISTLRLYALHYHGEGRAYKRSALYSESVLIFDAIKILLMYYS